MRSVHSFAAAALAIFLLWSPGIAATVEYTGKGLRDPFGDFNVAPAASPAAVVPTASGEEALSALTLQGIVLTSHKAQALIDGHMVEVGSEMPYGKITAIDRDGVTIFHNGKEFLLQRKKGEGANHGSQEA